MRSLLRVGVMALLLSSAAACLPLAPPAMPAPEDVSRAQERFPGVTLETLSQGRGAYVTNCGACHHLYPATKHKPEEWAKTLPEMAKRAKLTPPQEELILTYLVAMSVAPPAALPSPPRTAGDRGHP